MADDLHYVPGDNYLLCDITGFKIRRSKARLQWDNIATFGSHWSPRQPQDLVQAVRDEQYVSLSRPRQQNRFTVLATYVTVPSPAGATALTVASAVGFTVGDQCQVVLDNGNLFVFMLASVSGSTLGWTGQGLPWGVGGGFGDPLENQVLDLSRA